MFQTHHWLLPMGSMRISLKIDPELRYCHNETKRYNAPFVCGNDKHDGVVDHRSKDGSVNLREEHDARGDLDCVGNGSVHIWLRRNKSVETHGTGQA